MKAPDPHPCGMRLEPYRTSSQYFRHFAHGAHSLKAIHRYRKRDSIHANVKVMIGVEVNGLERVKENVLIKFGRRFSRLNQNDFSFVVQIDHMREVGVKVLTPKADADEAHSRDPVAKQESGVNVDVKQS